MRSWPLVALLLVTACKKEEPRAAPAPTAGLAERVRDRLKQAVPEATVVIVDAATVRAGVGERQLTLSLDNVRLRCTTDAACEDAIAVTVASFQSLSRTVGADGGRETVPTDKVLLALKDAEWLAGVDKLLKEKPEKYAENQLLLEPWEGSLSMVMVLDEPTGMRMLKHSDLASLHLSAPEVTALAKKNLAAMFPELTPMEEVKNTGVWTNSEDESYASALLVLPELWAPLARRVDGKLVVAVPARNRVFATGDKSAPRVQLMKTVVAQTVKEQDHSLVPTLFEWSPSGFKVRK